MIEVPLYICMSVSYFSGLIKVIEFGSNFNVLFVIIYLTQGIIL
jgi:hypothetical protein